MSARIDVLMSGYAETNDGLLATAATMKATGSCCLVRSSGMSILFDTLGPWERDLLIDRLNVHRIHPEDISYLVCSHSHPDHVGNLNLFTKAKKHFVGTSVYSHDIYDLDYFEPTGSYEYITKRDVPVTVPTYRDFGLDNNLSIQPTPGHTMECISMIVDNCDNHGRIALVGDLFERKEDIENEGIWLGAGSQNPDLQRANRSQIYNRVDHILPGHGQLFKTSKKEQLKF